MSGEPSKEAIKLTHKWLNGEYGSKAESLARLLDSFAAKARLEEARMWKPIGCVRAGHKPLRSPLCDVCQMMARWEERIASLEQAAGKP